MGVVRSAAILVLGATLVGGPASAVDVALDISTSSETLCTGAVSGVTFCDLTDVAEGEVTATWSLSGPEILNGYDLRVSWDDEELELLSCEALYSDVSGAVSLLFDPCVTDDPSGSDVAAISLVGLETTALFRMTFGLTDLALCDTDGLADLSWTPNGAGLSPGSVVLTNPGGASVDVGVAVKQCNDGVDNEGDGKIDFDGGVCAGLPVAEQTDPDPHCASAVDDTEKQQGCGIGFELAFVLGLIALVRARRRGR